MSTTTAAATAPVTPSLGAWYSLLSIEEPPPYRGVHFLGRVSPTHSRYAVVRSDGTIHYDGILAEPVTPERRALLKVELDLVDPLPDSAPLRLVR